MTYKVMEVCYKTHRVKIVSDGGLVRRIPVKFCPAPVGALVEFISPRIIVIVANEQLLAVG